MLDSVKEEYKRKIISIHDVANLIKSGDTIGTGLGIGGCSPDLHNAILERREKIKNVTFIDAVQVRPSKFYDPEFIAKLDGKINLKSLFVLNAARKVSQAKLLDFWPSLEGGQFFLLIP